MTTAREKIQEIGPRLLERKDQAAAIGAIYKFVLEGEGGGTFIVNLKDDIGITEGEGVAPCTIRMSGTDFVDLFEGRANGQALFFSQKLKVEGDIALALKLQAIQDMLR